MTSIFSKYFVFFFFLIILSGDYFAQNNSLQNQIRLANSFEARGQLKEAEDIYSRLHKQQPKNYQFYQSLNRTLQGQKKYQESMQLIQNQIKISKNKVALYGDLGSVNFLLGDEQKASEIWEEALKLEPNNAFAYRTIADYMFQNRIIERAIEVLELGNSVSKNKTVFSYDIANYYSLTMKFEEATKEYCKILANTPNQLNLIRNKINSYINSNKAAEPTLKTVLNIYEDGGNIIFLKLLAQLYLKTEFHKKALEATVKVEAKTTNNGSVIFAFAQQSTRIKDYKIAGMAYKNIIEKYPNSALFSEAEIGYTRSLEADLKNQTNPKENWKPLVINAAVNYTEFSNLVLAYQMLVEKYPDSKIGFEAEFRMARIYLDNLNEPIKADSIFNKIIAEVRTHQYIDEAYLGAAEISLERNDLQSAEVFLQKVAESRLAKSKLKSRANFLLAKTKMWKGEFSKSIISLNKVIENPKDENANDALQYLLILNTFKNDSTNLFFFSNADYLVKKRKFKEAAAEFKKLADNDNLFLLKDFAAIRYVELQLALNNYKEAIIFLEEISNCDEDNIYKDRFLYLLGSNYYYGLNNRDKAIVPLTRIFDEYPNSIYYNKVRKIISEINTGVKGNI